MDHKTFLKSLSNEDRNRLNEKRDAPGLVRLTVHLGLVLALAVGIGMQIPGWWLLIPVQGVLLAFLFNLEHECTHKTPFRSEWINELAGRISGFLIFQPFLWFRYFHLAHHRHTNDPERDPELVGRPKPATWREYIIFVSSVLYWRGKVMTLFQSAFGTIEGDFIPKSSHGKLRREARLWLTLYGLLILGSLIANSLFLVWAWLLPLAFGNPFLRLYHLAEHGRCPTVENMFENTRTVFTNPVVLFFGWNMPFHIEHHTAPNVPFHQLPELNRLANDYLVTTADGYVAFTRDYASHLDRQETSA